jgi:hypothetical protein
VVGFCDDDDDDDGSSGPTTGSLLLTDNYQLFKAEFVSTLLFISVALATFIHAVQSLPFQDQDTQLTFKFIFPPKILFAIFHL